MGVGILALAFFVPAIVIAVVLALWFAVSAASAGHSLTAITSLLSLVMIASPLACAAFAARPEPGEENPFFLIEYGIFPSAVLATVALTAALMLRKRWWLLAAPLLALASLAYVVLISVAAPAAGVSGIDGVAGAGPVAGLVPLVVLASYPLIWVLALRELAAYVEARLAKPAQG